MGFEDELERAIPHLRRYARALTRDLTRADDLVQDCLERALARRHLFRPGSPLKPWLFRIMHNIHVNELRARAARPAEVAFDPAAADASAAARAGERLALRDVARALDALSEEQRQVLLLVVLEDFTYREVAEVLGIPVGTVMSRLSRARETLRRALDGEGPRLRRVK